MYNDPLENIECTTQNKNRKNGNQESTKDNDDVVGKGSSQNNCGRTISRNKRLKQKQDVTTDKSEKKVVLKWWCNKLTNVDTYPQTYGIPQFRLAHKTHGVG